MSNSRKAQHKRPTRSHTRQGVALAVTTVVSAGVVIGGAGAAGAAEKPISQSRGFFLSGSALGVDLDDIVKLDDARAVNDGSPATVTKLNPLGVTLLNSLKVPLGPVNLLGDNGLLKLGAVNQAAIARSNGSAIGASGAVSDSGAIAVDGNNNVPASNATLDLSGVLGNATLGNGLTDGLLDVDLIVGAISANATQAKGQNGNQAGDYRIADLKLNLQSPLLADLLGGLNLTDSQSQLGGLETTLNGLNLGSLLGGLGIGDLLATPSLDVANLPVLADIVADQDLTVGDGAITVDLSNGKITVDVEALLISLGLDLNNLPPNTELIGLIMEALTKGVGNLVEKAVKDLAADITTAFEDIDITGSAVPLIPGPAQALPTAGLLTALQPTLDGVLDTVLDPVTGLLADVAGPLLNPLFDALEDLLSIRVNVQNKSDGMFTQRAIQIRVLPGGGAGVTTAAVNDSLATVNLASASVGPGQGRVGGEGAPDEDDNDNDNVRDRLPDTGAAESAPVAAAGLALMLAGAAATAGSSRMGSSSGAHAGARGRGSSGGGRHARR